MSKAEVLEMKKSISDFKEDISNLKDPDLSQEMDSVNDYLNCNNHLSSSFEEAFPNYVRDIGLNKELVDDNVKENSVSNVLKILNDVLKKCKEAGIEKICLEQIKISEIVKNVSSNESFSITKEVEKLVIDQLNNIGSITLKEMYDKVIIFKDKYELNVNYLELGYNLVSYGILLRAYNKLIYNRKIPTGLSTQDLVVIRQVRSIGRVWFAGLVAPLMLFSFHALRKRNSLLDINIVINNNENNNNYTFLLLLFKNIGIKRVILFILLLLIVILLFYSVLYWNGINLINYKVFNYENIYSYLRLLLLISILIPIIINTIILYLFVIIERKGKISIPILCASHPPLAKHEGPGQQNKRTNKFIGYLVEICKNKELLNYYKIRNKGEILFYLLILLLVLIIFT